MLILLPPSEGKHAPARGRRLDLEALSFPSLTRARDEVLDALVELCAGELDRAVSVLGLGATQADEVRRNGGLCTAPTARADAIYSGVLYDALDVDSLDTAARARASRRLVVTSSLFGLVRPTDRIPAYRLSGGATLPGVGRLAAHWRKVTGPVIREAASSGLVVDLRSATYAAFWRPAAGLAERMATVRVLQQVGAQRKVVSHFNKATKGRIVRDLLQSGAAPRRPVELAEELAGLGWTVELEGTALDVVVNET